jgi:hypothetical protein
VAPVSALGAVLARLVDYAGLFPPAQCDMPSAVRSYAAYRAGPDAWMLGRFVLPAARLTELEAGGGGSSTVDHPWPMSALIGPNVASDAEEARDFNRRMRGRAMVETLEVKAGTTDEIQRVADAAADFELYVEIPVSADPVELIDALRAADLSAKIRTGGITPDVFPTGNDVVRFMRRCIEAGVAFKATAGLHHPLRAEYRLTYEPGAICAPMFGYLNVFLAAAFMRTGMPDGEARWLLEDTDPAAFAFDDDAAAWRDHRIATADLTTARQLLCTSFGSCSFREPVDELAALGWTA